MSLDRLLINILQGMISNTLLIKGVIWGALPSGKNNYKISGGRMYKDQKISLYENDFLKQIKSIKLKYKLFEPIDDDVMLVAKVMFPSLRRDVDTILFCDLLQQSKVVVNDRRIRVKLIDGIETDATQPRVVFALYKLGGVDGLERF